MTGSNFSLTGGVRFAPSPTGRFHIGNLRTAWIAHIFAKTHNLPLVARFEDIDKPRVLAGAKDKQISDMQDLGIDLDQIYLQSDRHELHFSLFKEAARQGLIYACDCSRKEVQTELSSLASAPHSPHAIYSGHCRKRGSTEVEHPKSESLAWRFKMPDVSGQEDFVIARTPPQNSNAVSTNDFTPAYHWACAIDDHAGRYGLLLRAWDLETSARLQRAIQGWLCKREGNIEQFSPIFHTSLVTADDGSRLEKRTKGVTLPELHERGIDSPSLQRLFAKSFDSSLVARLPQTSSLSGEKLKAISLTELGLSSAV